MMECPNCGSDNIIEVNQGLVGYKVVEWDEGIPVEFGTYEVYGDSMAPAFFECGSCHEQWETEYIAGAPEEN